MNLSLWTPVSAPRINKVGKLLMDGSSATPCTTKKVKQKPFSVCNFSATTLFVLLLPNLRKLFDRNRFTQSVILFRLIPVLSFVRCFVDFFVKVRLLRQRKLLNLLVTVLCCSTALCCFQKPVDARVARHVRVVGDVMLYGLFPIHHQRQTSTTTTRSSSFDQQQQPASPSTTDSDEDESEQQSSAAKEHNADADTCDSLDFVGIYLLEAALFALDRAAAIMPESVTLGADFSDTCASPDYAYHRARHYAQQARAHNQAEKQQPNELPPPVSLGVIGPAQDNELERTAELLSQYEVPQIAYWATTPTFSDKSRFPYMFRSIPDARYEATAVLDLLKQLSWNIVHIVYAQDGFYRSLAVELDRMAATRQICVASLLPGPSEAEFKEDENNRIAMRVVRSATKSKLSVNVVLWLGKAWDLQYILRAMNETGAKGKIQLVGLSAWGDDRASLNDHQHLAEGALTLKMPTPAPLDFQTYFSYLKPTINPRNPWFIEFWETYFRCQFVQRNPTFIKEGYQICTNNEEYSPILDYDLDESAANYVIDAVLAFAHAFRAMHFDKCRTFPGICPLMRPFNQTEFTFNYLRYVSFDSLTPLATEGSGASSFTPSSSYMPFSFHHGSNDRAEAHFQILNFQRDSASTQVRRYKLEHVGNWYSRAAVRHRNNTRMQSHQQQNDQQQLRGRIFLDRSRLQTLEVQPIVCPQACQAPECADFVRPKAEPRPSKASRQRSGNDRSTTLVNGAANTTSAKPLQITPSDAKINQSTSSETKMESDDAADYGETDTAIGIKALLNLPASMTRFAITVMLLLLFGISDLSILCAA